LPAKTVSFAPNVRSGIFLVGVSWLVQRPEVFAWVFWTEDRTLAIEN
jgi:hypothetical protein